MIEMMCNEQAKLKEATRHLLCKRRRTKGPESE
jgi:hypothetical protein